MTAMRYARWFLSAISIAIVVVADLILLMVKRAHNGTSRWMLLRWFAAVRLYGLLLATNVIANAIMGQSTFWSFGIFMVGTVYLLYSLVAFWRVLRGRWLP